jgi:tripartite-type tricarboxylate transporter receptor subunit TctC
VSSVRFFINVAIVLSLTFAALSTNAFAQIYPNKPVHLVVPFPPGSAPDVLARILGQKLGEAWNQSVIIDNRTGAASIIGAGVVAKSAPDGYTLLLGNDTAISMNPVLYSKLPYDSLRDFAPVGLAATITMVLVASPALAVKSVPDLVEMAKARPGQINYASGGNGSAPHICMEMFKSLAGINLVPVQYKGVGAATNDVIAGQIQVMFASAATAVPYVRTGRLRALASGGSKRSAAMPEIPTMAEAGVPGFYFVGWMGVLAPTGTPRAIIDKLNADVNSVLNVPEVKEKLAVLGVDVATGTPDQFLSLIKNDLVRFAKVARDAGIKPDEN